MQNLETNLSQIFLNKSIQDGLNNFLEVGKRYGLVADNSKIFYNEALNSAFQLKQMQNVYREDLLRLVNLFHVAANKDECIFKLYAYLGEMVCYWFLGEYNLVKSIKNTVANTQYSRTWWEKNRRDILSFGGGALAGLAALLTGGFSVPITGGIAIAGYRSLQSCISDSSEMEVLFNKFKSEIVSINLCI